MITRFGFFFVNLCNSPLDSHPSFWILCCQIWDEGRRRKKPFFFFFFLSSPPRLRVKPKYFDTGSFLTRDIYDPFSPGPRWPPRGRSSGCGEHHHLRCTLETVMFLYRYQCPPNPSSGSWLAPQGWRTSPLAFSRLAGLLVPIKITGDYGFRQDLLTLRGTFVSVYI